MRKHINYFDYDQLNNTSDVLRALLRLDDDLDETELQSLKNFNHTYAIITRKVHEAMQGTYFDNPEFLNRFDARFAYYYTHALDNYLHNQTVAPAWQAAFQHAKHHESSPLIQMALGVNAHVNNDIPQVLLDCEADRMHHDDFLKVNGLIADSIDEVISKLEDSKRFTDPKKPVIAMACKPVMKRLIKSWRDAAWRNFEAYKNQEISVEDIEQSARKKVRQLSMLPI